MEKKDRERRQDKRALFTIENGILATFTVPGGKIRTMTAYVLNLSIGGIFFTMRQEEVEKIIKGDRVIFLNIKFRKSHPFILNAEAEIVWRTGEPAREYSGVGCRFLNLSANSEEQIFRFIEHWNQKAIGLPQHGHSK
jgi:c-di-GMP-binding flagellar brake protein YcgR